MDLCVELVRRADTSVCREVCANKQTICSRRMVFKHVGYLFDGSVRRRLPFDLFLSASKFSTQQNPKYSTDRKNNFIFRFSRSNSLISLRIRADLKLITIFFHFIPSPTVCHIFPGCLTFFPCCYEHCVKGELNVSIPVV